MKNNIELTEQEMQLQIEQILQEASAYGLRYEVRNTALALMQEYPNLDWLQAYEAAYHDWIK